MFKIITLPVCSVVHLKNDPRPHAVVEILGNTFTGLLDSGASCTILGNGSIELMKQLGIKINPCKILIKTADGKPHNVSGSVDLPVSFANKVEVMTVLLSPTIAKTLILGIDFWKRFGITPVVSCFSIEKVVKFEHSLDCNQIKSLKQAIKCLPISGVNQIGRTNVLEHFIDTQSAMPIKQRPYLYSPKLEQAINSEIDRMLSLGVIEPSNSPWGNPLVAVPKPNGSTRVCLDSRKLNDVTKRDAYPLPHISRILGRLRETKYLSTVDLKDAFWQIPLEESSKEKTAFAVSGRGQFQFKVMPFGLHNAAQSQSRLMDRVLGNDLEPFVFYYLDDIVIMSNDFDKHLLLIQEVGKRLSKAKLTINLEKSAFCRKQLRYLGYVITELGLKTDPAKVTPILNFPKPTCVKEVRQFIGVAGWYRRFIKNFSSIAAPITELTKKPKKKFIWCDNADSAFRVLKTALVSAPILRNPDFTQPFTIQADASDKGVGAVITQGEGDEERVIAYFSKKLEPAQTLYTTTEKECLAVILAIQQFRCYIEGDRFKVITDHASLKWLRNLKDPSGRLGRWALFLQQYDYEIVHRKGKDHVVPDALSRNIGAMEIFMITNDEWYISFRKNILDDPSKYSAFKVEKDLIYKYVIEGFDFKWKLVVPTEMRKQILKDNHDGCCHFGFMKTLCRIRNDYYWPRMAIDVREYVKNCKACKGAKSTTTNLVPEMGRQKISVRPWHTISIDYWGPVTRSTKGFKYVLVVADWFSKFVLLHPVRDANKHVTCEFLEESVFLEKSTPKFLISDNSPIFVNEKMKALMERYGITHLLNNVYHPQFNPSERIMKVLGASLRTFIVGPQTHWSDHLKKIQCAINTARHESTLYTPFHIINGNEMIINGNDYERHSSEPINIEDRNDHLSEVRRIVRENIKRAYTRYSKYYNLRTKPVSYQAGDIVWRKNLGAKSNKAKQYSKKLDNLYVECKIKRVIGSSSYEIEDTNGNYVGIYHAKDLKPN